MSQTFLKHQVISKSCQQSIFQPKLTNHLVGVQYNTDGLYLQGNLSYYRSSSPSNLWIQSYQTNLHEDTYIYIINYEFLKPNNSRVSVSKEFFFFFFFVLLVLTTWMLKNYSIAKIICFSKENENKSKIVIFIVVSKKS